MLAANPRSVLKVTTISSGVQYAFLFSFFIAVCFYWLLKVVISKVVHAVAIIEGHTTDCAARHIGSSHITNLNSVVEAYGNGRDRENEMQNYDFFANQ